MDFILADCTQPTVYAGGPFDLVFGAWLLNYAPDRAGLVAMFRNVAGNLRAGGRFVSVTVPPARDPTAAILAETKARPPPDGSGGFNNRILHDVDGGVCFRVYGATELGNMAFDCYHLRSDLYEAAAREAGLSGDWTWDVTAVPDRFLRGDGPGGASIAELKSYQTVPGFGLLVVTK